MEDCAIAEQYGKNQMKDLQGNICLCYPLMLVFDENNAKICPSKIPSLLALFVIFTLLLAMMRFIHFDAMFRAITVGALNCTSFSEWLWKMSVNRPYGRNCQSLSSICLHLRSGARKLQKSR